MLTSRIRQFAPSLVRILSFGHWKVVFLCFFFMFLLFFVHFEFVARSEQRLEMRWFTAAQRSTARDVLL